MYAIVATGGKQYKVANDDVIEVEKLAAEPGDKVEFKALALVDGTQVTVDADSLAKAKVEGEVVEQFKGKKQIVFKFKRRKGYKRTRGHRQQLTRVKITNVVAG
jgi:large subunit ribosomal protein L21